MRNRYNQAPHLTQDTTLESDINTIKHQIQESQEVSPFPAVTTRLQLTDKKTRQTRNINNKIDP